MRGRVRREGEAVLLCRLAQPVADGARLDAAEARLRVDCKHALQVFRAVDDHRGVHALPALRGAPAACQERRAVRAASSHRRFDVGDALRQHHADRHLTVIRCVSGVRSACAAVEAHLAGEACAQRRLESLKTDHL
jgi:hypothetical protein